MSEGRKNVDELSGNSVRMIKSKYKKTKIALKEKFAHSIAPGQVEDVKDILSSSDEESQDVLDDSTKSLIKVFNPPIPATETNLPHSSCISSRVSSKPRIAFCGFP